MIGLIGWTGALLLAFCGLPQALQSIEQGHSEGVSEFFVLMWGIGEICCMVYVYKTRERMDWPLMTNYILNLTFITIIGYFLI